MKRFVSNSSPYPIDTPVVLVPGETAEVEGSDDVQRLIDAGLLTEQESDQAATAGSTSTEPESKTGGPRHRKTEDSK